MLRGLENNGCEQILLACCWNERKKIGAMDVAPIVRRYIDPCRGFDVFVVVKSLISSACVVRTKISELVHDHHPDPILGVAPVILAGSTRQLESEFDTATACRCDYVWFAQDDEKMGDGEVVPGIGGSVYELLGISTASRIPTANQSRFILAETHNGCLVPASHFPFPSLSCFPSRHPALMILLAHPPTPFS